MDRVKKERAWPHAMRRVLFVAPQSLSSGEALTALQLARDVCAFGGAARFICSPFTARVVGEQLETAPVVLSGDLTHNQSEFWGAFSQFSPDLVVFADFATAGPSAGGVPLVDERLVAALEDSSCALASFDHLGLAEGGSVIGATILSPPPSMCLLLPCPPGDPSAERSQRGVPFRSWTPPSLPAPPVRETIRQGFLGSVDGILVFHAVPRWTEEMCRIRNIPYYRYLPRILSSYLAHFPSPVTIVSVNEGGVLPPAEGGRIRFVNVRPLPPAEFDTLLLAADLVMSENCLSVTLGKAICAGIPALLWRNSYEEARVLVSLVGDAALAVRDMVERYPGSVFPWAALPYWRPDMVRSLSTFTSSSNAAALAILEIYGGRATAELLRALLGDAAVRDRLREAQLALGRGLAALPTAYVALRGALGTSPEPSSFRRSVDGGTK